MAIIDIAFNTHDSSLVIITYSLTYIFQNPLSLKYLFCQNHIIQDSFLSIIKIDLVYLSHNPVLPKSYRYK